MLGGAVEVYRPAVVEGEPESMPSPGVGIRHYAPRARLVLVSQEDSGARRLRWLRLSTRYRIRRIRLG